MKYLIPLLLLASCTTDEFTIPTSLRIVPVECEASIEITSYTNLDSVYRHFLFTTDKDTTIYFERAYRASVLAKSKHVVCEIVDENVRSVFVGKGEYTFLIQNKDHRK